MKWQEEPESDTLMERTKDVVELQLLLPAHQFSALEAVAAQLEMTVATLLRRAIADLLRPRSAAGFVGEVASRPSAPLAAFHGFN